MMARLAVVLTLLLTLFFCTITEAQDRDFGIGIIIGEPTGFSFKKWSSGTTAVDGAIGWSFGQESRLHLRGDYLVHNFDLFQVETDKVAPYYGVGGRIKIVGDETRIGVRFPLGINYIFQKVPLDIFVESAAVLDMGPRTRFEFNAAVGIRYSFLVTYDE